MEIVIDGNTLGEEQVSGNNLEEVVDDLQKRHVAMNRTIVEVRVNGEIYHEKVPHDAGSFQRDAIKSLEVFTKSPREVAIHFMENAEAIVANIQGSLPRISELFREGKGSEASEHFLKFLGAFQLLVRLLPQVNTIFPGFLYQEDGGHPSLASQLGDIEANLSSLLQAQETSDWNVLANTLEAEFTPTLTELQASLGALEGWVKGRAEA